MARYAGSVRSFAPVTTDDNWALAAGASKSLKVLEVHWGGELTTSTAMNTRVTRGASQTGATTLGNVEKIHPNSPANGVSFALTFATTQPTLNSGDLFSESWNAHGGVIRWLAAPGEEFILIGAATELCLCNRNSVGTGTSTYGVIWEED